MITHYDYQGSAFHLLFIYLIYHALLLDLLIFSLPRDIYYPFIYVYEINIYLPNTYTYNNIIIYVYANHIFDKTVGVKMHK